LVFLIARLLVVKPAYAVAIAAAVGLLFFFAGEGTASRPMAARRFSVREFFSMAGKQWLFGVGFMAGGACLGWLITSGLPHEFRASTTLSTPGAVALGAAAAGLLGFIVPTLYELYYVHDATMNRRIRLHTIRYTLASAVVIGVIGGIVVALALDIAFGKALVLLAVPMGVVLGVLDILGLPSAAVALWAIHRRGPLRIGSFLRIVEELGLARVFGGYYVLEHPELRRYLASKSPPAHQ
jgi:hypothetical protein